MTQTVANTPTGDTRIDALLGPFHWAPVSGTDSVSFSFPSAASSWSNMPGDYGSGGTTEPTTGFAALTAAQQDAVRAALAAWGAVADIRLWEIADAGVNQGTLRFAWTLLNPEQQSEAYPPGTLQKSGDVWLNSQPYWDGFAPGTYGFASLLHEIGHALGLKHPFEGGVVLPASEDGYAQTLMSASASAGSPGSWSSVEPSTPMLDDILAIQSIYGANTSTHAGDDVYVFGSGTSAFQTLWDAGGQDTIRWDSSTRGTTIDLRPGSLSSLGDPITFWNSDFSRSWTDARTVAIAWGVTIENAIGGQLADLILGNDAANRLEGGGGDDSLSGGPGDDALVGGAGNDALSGGTGTDTARFSAARTGCTVVKSGSNFVITDRSGPEGTDTLVGIERLQFADKTFELANLPRAQAPDYGKDAGFLFDGVYYLLAHAELVPTVTLATALQSWMGAGAARHDAPNSWFDAAYYSAKWADLSALHLDDATLFMHYNLYGVWEGRSAGPKFDHFDGPRYLSENPDVAAYVDANLAGFLGSRTNGAIAHFIIYGANEQRVAHETAGGVIDMGYVL